METAASATEPQRICNRHHLLLFNLNCGAMTMVPHFSAILLAGALGLATTTCAQAQSEASGSRTRALPRNPVKPVLDASFRAIPASREDLTLRGELATSERAIYLSPADALRATAFRVGFTNAVSNLPDVSRLSVKINDQIVGEISLNASSELGQAVFPVPPGVLVAGYNSVRFTASQRHRVDCSVMATYELWTEVSPVHTGLVNLSSTPQIRRATDLPMLAGIAAGRTPIRLRLTEGLSATGLDQAMRAANALVLAGLITHPVIEVSGEPGSGPGIDLVVGNAAVGGAGVRLEHDLGLFVSQEINGDRTTITFQTTPEADIGRTIQALERLAAQRLRPGSKAGQRAIANMLVQRAGNDSSFSFADLGMETRSFDGRLLRMSAQLMLPADFFPAPYGAARLALNTAFSGTANAAQRMNISVNDQIAAIVPIVKPGTGGIVQRVIELPLQAFKPGANVITIEASLADTTAACDATSNIAPPSRLSLGAGSTLSFGRLARLASYPNLSAALSTGFPYAGSTTPMPVGVSSRDPAFLDGAMTMVSRIVASAQVPIPTAFRFGLPDDVHQPGIFFGSLSEAPSEAPGLGIPSALLAPARDHAVPAARTQLAAVSNDGAVQLDGSGYGVTMQSREPASIPLAEHLRETFDMSALIKEVRRLSRGDLGNLKANLQEFGLLDKSSDAARIFSTGASGDTLLIKQTVQPNLSATAWQGFVDLQASPAVRTVVLAADPEQFVGLIEKATTSQFWPRFNGEAARVRLEDWGPQNLPSAQPVYGVSADSSVGNLRLVAAGWLSLNQNYYLAILVSLVALLALTTTVALRTRRT